MVSAPCASNSRHVHRTTPRFQLFLTHDTYLCFSTFVQCAQAHITITKTDRGTRGSLPLRILTSMVCDLNTAKLFCRKNGAAVPNEMLLFLSLFPRVHKRSLSTRVHMLSLSPSGGPRVGMSTTTKMAINTMLNQRRGGAGGGGYMTPMSNPQQVRWRSPAGRWAGPGGRWAGPGGRWAGPGGRWVGPSGRWAGPVGR